ncbi:TerD family protein [Escherichia coli]|uniref:Tellurium resistance protein TerD n=1 Tax=Escherichia coli TaxID=562 RepID=A0A6G9I4E2_ECOLX|nr:Tellurium resistance protein TerD [Escherichia coli]
MAVSLVKGGNVSLTKEAPTMNIAMVGLGWDARVTDGQAFDLDASVFAVGEDGKVLSDAHFIFFNNKTSPDGAVEHQGDNRTGEGDGDDEQVKIDLTKVSADIKKTGVCRYIYDAEARKQNFGMVEQQLHTRLQQRQRHGNCPFRSVMKMPQPKPLWSSVNCIVMALSGSLKAVGQGFAGGLAALASQHGVNI